jgi:hypothetical protein
MGVRVASFRAHTESLTSCTKLRTSPARTSRRRAPSSAVARRRAARGARRPALPLATSCPALGWLNSLCFSRRSARGAAATAAGACSQPASQTASEPNRQPACKLHDQSAPTAGLVPGAPSGPPPQPQAPAASRPAKQPASRKAACLQTQRPVGSDGRPPACQPASLPGLLPATAPLQQPESRLLRRRAPPARARSSVSRARCRAVRCLCCGPAWRLSSVVEVQGRIGETFDSRAESREQNKRLALLGGSAARRGASAHRDSFD